MFRSTPGVIFLLPFSSLPPARAGPNSFSCGFSRLPSPFFLLREPPSRMGDEVGLGFLAQSYFSFFFFFPPGVIAGAVETRSIAML